MLIYRLARRTPDKVAIIDSDLTAYSYSALNGMVDKISSMFPVDSPSRIGVLASNSVRQIAAIIAVIKSGSAYVPLDPATSGSAIRNAIASANVDFVIADKENIDRLGDIEALLLPDTISYEERESYAPINFGRKTVACAMPDDGGSTYQELSGIAVRRHASYLCDEFGISSSDVVLQGSVATSPMFLAEVFAPLMKGAAMAILPAKNRGYAKAVADFAERAGVTVICGYRPMVDEIGLLQRLPSRLRMMIGVASDRLWSTLSSFNKSRDWLGWFSVTFGSSHNPILV